MPITRRFGVNQNLEDYEELDEYFQFPSANQLKVEEENQHSEEIPETIFPFWKRWWNFLKLTSSRF